MVGTNERDVIVGTPRRDVIAAFDGDDRIDGRGGHDVICGGEGDDTLLGGAGSDQLFGGRGNDRLSGGPGGVTYWTGMPTPWEGLDGGPGRDDLDRRDLRWGRFVGDRCFLGRAIVACPGPRPAGLVE
jgi:Ca2+-binding RTX toxin-like protein